MPKCRRSHSYLSPYFRAVPRWGDVNGDRQSGKDIDRLLEPEQIGSSERDIW
jgi:hypothetical protein